MNPGQPQNRLNEIIVSNKTLWKNGSQQNKGVVFTDLIGRPPLLDEKNVAAITNRMTETSYKPTDRNYAENLHQQVQIK